MKKIDTKSWKRFSLAALGFKNYHGNRLKKCDRVSGDIPFITAGKENTGIAGTIGNDVEKYQDAITVDMFGNVFFHQGIIAGDDNVYFFVNEELGDYAKLFISSSIKAELGDKFAYVDQFRQDNADKLSVKLPVSVNGEPDWEYMEQYMQSIEMRVNGSISTLNALLGGVDNGIK